MNSISWPQTGSCELWLSRVCCTIPPVVLFRDAHVAHHPLYLLQLNSVQFSVADPDPGSGAFLTPRSGSRDGWKIRIRIRDEPPGSGTIQCCGSGSGIRCLFDPWIRDPGRVKNLDPDRGWTTRIRNNSVLRIWIRDPVPFWSLDPGSGKGKKSGPGFGRNNQDHVSYLG